MRFITTGGNDVELSRGHAGSCHFRRRPHRRPHRRGGRGTAISQPGVDARRCCPEGFRPATPPLNPALGCLPDNVYMPPPLPDPFIPPGGCPSGWQPVTPPLNPVLICLPTQIILQPELLRAVESAARLPGGMAAGDAAAQPSPDLSAEHDRHSDAGTRRRLPRRLGAGQRRRATPRWAACRIPSSFR